MVCTKRVYVSKTQARRAHRHAGWRVRVYQCPVCHRLHVTNDNKR